MSVRIQPLFNFVSECLNGDKLEFKKNPYGLVGNTIHVESFDLVDSTYNGQTSKVNKVRWSIINYQDSSIMDKMIVYDDFDPEDYEQEFDPEDLVHDDGFNPEDFIEDEFDPQDFIADEFNPEDYIEDELMPED